MHSVMKLFAGQVIVFLDWLNLHSEWKCGMVAMLTQPVILRSAAFCRIFRRFRCVLLSIGDRNGGIIED